MNDFFENIQEEPQPQSGSIYPPKPHIEEKTNNSLIRSISSLLIYFFLFYFLFEKNVAYIAAILVVIIIHEMGHLLAMKAFNYSNVKIFILPLIGALTTGKKQNVSQLQLSIIILAGPLPGIIISCLLFWLNMSMQNETVKMLANSFLFINLFNLLPVFPLDGGRLLETLFFKQNFIVRLVFGILSIMALSVLFLVSNPIMLIVPAMMGIDLFNENKNNKIREYLSNERINFHQDYNDISDKDYWLIRDCILFSFAKKYNGVQPGVYQYSLIEPIMVQHVKSVLQINLQYDLKVISQILIVLLYLSSIIVPLVLYGLFF